MSLSGPEALRSLDEALRDVRREEDEIAKRLARSAELITRRREQEGELLSSLAQVRLDPAIQAELRGQISAAELRAREMLKTHGEDLSASEGQLKTLDADLTKAIADRTKLQDDATRLNDELKALSDRVRPQHRRRRRVGVAVEADRLPRHRALDMRQGLDAAAVVAGAGAFVVRDHRGEPGLASDRKGLVERIHDAVGLVAQASARRALS